MGELLVARKVMEFSLRDVRSDVETKETNLRSKFEPYAKARAATERDMKVARIENIRAKNHLKAVKKVLKQLSTKYVESKKAVRMLEETCKNATSNYREAERRHEEELHTIEHL